MELDFVVKALDEKKRVAPNGSPYWMARELMVILGYSNWVNFKSAIEKAITSCETSGIPSSDQFVETSEMISIGKGGKRKVDDWCLSKYACDLIAMNGDSSKAEIATAQTYFAIQTHRQESQDLLTDQERRLLLRNRVKDGNKKLSSAAKDAGVRSSMFGVFHDAGYKGLYKGLGVRDIKKLKGIDEKEDLLDCMGRAELAANEFRITQTEEVLRNKNVSGENSAINTHAAIGRKVRQTIEEIGGTVPEKLRPEPSIKELAQKAAKQLKNEN
jgi:DNA-damage-inducible protein D